MLGLGWPQWLLIIGLVGGLILTFKVMARASVAYARARENRERLAAQTAAEAGGTGGAAGPRTDGQKGA